MTKRGMKGERGNKIGYFNQGEKRRGGGEWITKES